MRDVEFIDQLLTASKLPGITFHSIQDSVISITSSRAISRLSASRIIENYLRHGFAVIQLESEQLSPDTLLGLGDAFQLGEAFTPPLYQMGEYRADSVSKISAQGKEEDPAHPSFERTVGLKLHCDGTLQKINFVKTTIMLCKSAGAEGGETTLFNATGAFAELATLDLAAALALTQPGVLRRQANINGCRDINDGPAFTVQDNQLVCAYSVTETDSWITTTDVDEAALRRGVEFMLAAAEPGSPYFIQFGLTDGQAIILANSKISHGRTSFRDNPNHRRCLYRGLYLKHPELRIGLAKPYEAAQYQMMNT